jgi:diadenylate cyclase
LLLLFKIWFVEITWIDLLDITLVSLLIFQVYKILRGSVAVRILLGILFISVIYVVVNAFNLKLLSMILGQFFGVGVVATLILFQQEIRKFLLLLGRSQMFGNEGFTFSLPWKKTANIIKIDVNAVVEATRTMGASNTGALMVFSRSSELKFYAESGDKIDGILSKRLIISIFNKYCPLHDGAVIVSVNGRIKAARCILPVSENDEIPASMGLRHRAALGLTEITDAIVVVVSEETGQIALMKNGIAFTNLSPQELRNKLNKLLSGKPSRLKEMESEPIFHDD